MRLLFFAGLVFNVGGCLLVGNLRSILSEGTRAGSGLGPPTIIEFVQPPNGDMRCALRRVAQCVQLEVQMQAFVQLVNDAVAATAGSSDAGSAITSSSAVPARRPLFIDLDAVKQASLPLMPTLNGWLLGYPFVYWVDSRAAADAACRHLSSTTLVLYRVELHPSAQLIAELRGCSAAEALLREPPLLCAFSIPEYVSSDEAAAAVEAALGEINQRVAAFGLWQPAAMSRSIIGPQPVAL